MPGHKGNAVLGCEPLDLTEISGADVLSDPTGIILESEQNAASLFGTRHTFFSAEGSTLCVKAMLALAAWRTPHGKRPRILAARNVHKSFVYGCALLDIDAVFLSPDANAHLCACPITPAAVAEALDADADGFCAVYLTSPDYLGNVQDIKGVAAVCHARGVPLLVDNAHGAYLAFTDPVRHPIALGADLCADSAHKTLPVLTGGAYLHVSHTAPDSFLQGARRALSLFASTSPSYLILQSLDLCNRYLARAAREDLKNTAKRCEICRASLAKAGYVLTGSEPLKITLSGTERGYTGDELANTLRAHGIEPEFSDDALVVLMCTGNTTEQALARTTQVLCALRAKKPLSRTPTPLPRAGKRYCSLREALLSPFTTVPVKDSVGRICAAPTVSCPPAIPVVMSGERIEADAIPLLLSLGITEIDVLSN